MAYWWNIYASTALQGSLQDLIKTAPAMKSFQVRIYTEVYAVYVFYGEVSVTVRGNRSQPRGPLCSG
jgi:hypothetical protein